MLTTVDHNKHLLFQGGGEMGRRIREYNWAASSLGPISTWPASLCNAINIVLSSRFPMFIWWGPELIQFYNDAYRPSLGNTGKHPTALGQRGEDCWPEIWHIIYPLMRQVLNGGEATWSEDQLIPIYRNGHLEDVYWTFSYSPIIDEQAAVRGVLVVCTETTDKVLANDRLRQAQNTGRLAIESAQLGVYEMDLLTNMVISSQRFNSIVGLEPPITRTDLLQLLHPDYKEIQAHAQSRALATGILDYETRMIRPDHRQRWLRIKGLVSYSDTGKPETITGVIQDITLEKRQEEKLTELVTERTNELQRSNADLMQFAHVISHDLKEPVRKIRLYAHRLLEKEGRSPELEKYADKILHSTARMNSMILGVLNYSSLNANRDALQTVDLNEIVRNVLIDLEVLILEKNARMNIGPLPHVYGAQVLIRQLFYNLINNSLKFSKDDTDPVIEIREIHETPEIRENSERHEIREIHSLLAHIAISDNGIGFEPAYETSIFQSFTRLNSKDRYEGTGLGLSLCKKIVERHGGSIRATGKAGAGATFYISLPSIPVNILT